MKFQMLKKIHQILSKITPESNLTKKITSDNIQLSPGKKRMLEFLKKNSK